MTTLTNVSAPVNPTHRALRVRLSWLFAAIASALLLGVSVSRARPSAPDAAPQVGRQLAPIDVHGVVQSGKRLAPRDLHSAEGVKPGKSLPPPAHVAR